MKRFFVVSFLLLMLVACSSEQPIEEKLEDTKASDQEQLTLERLYEATLKEGKKKVNEIARNEKEKIESYVQTFLEEESTDLLYSSGTTEQYKMKFDSLYDADTFHATFLEGPNKGEKVKIRLLLVDAPELKDKHTGQAQPFAEKAKERSEELLTSGEITAEYDIGEKVDKYGRALLYIRVDGKLLQAYLAEEGLVRIAYINPPNTRYLEELKAAEQIAKEKNIGIWSIDGYSTPYGFNP